MAILKANYLFWIVNICLVNYILTGASFNIKRENLNRRLVSGIFSDLTVDNYHDCARACFNFGGKCKSVNFNRKNKQCELNAKGQYLVDDSEFEKGGEYIFSDITEWPKLMTGGCSNENCLDHQKCQPIGKSDFNCVDKANCGEAPPIGNGSVSAPVTLDGATATYSCNFGFENNGHFTKKKCIEGIWSSETIMCSIKDCGALANIAYGTVSATSTTHGSTATYSCQYGYEHVSGDLTRNCVDGTWDGIESICAAKDCGTPPVAEHGIVSATSTTHGSTATYSCLSGYEHVSGDLTINCVDGTWNGNEPTCAPEGCGALANIAYGTVSASSTTHGSTATYSCQYGYEHVSGDLTRNCMYGTWDGIEPVCKIKDCGSLSLIYHGDISVPYTTHGSTAVYSCHSDYQITSGHSTRTCDNGLWTGYEAVCTAIPNVGCYISGQAYQYHGTAHYTNGGLLCQRWDSQSPHEHDRVDQEFPESSLSMAQNYCRDPDFEGGPWCYTTDPDNRWDFCNVPVC